jgi:hypothetical protein
MAITCPEAANFSPPRARGVLLKKVAKCKKFAAARLDLKCF